MGRLTQMIVYLNSEPSDWNTPPNKISYSDFTHFNITKEAKKFRKIYRENLKKEQENLEEFLNKTDDIYFIGNIENKVCKIGYSNNIPERLKALQTSCPFDLEILKTSCSLYKKEREYHKKFLKLNIRGEWFKLEGDLNDYIKSPHWRDILDCKWSEKMIQNANSNKEYYIFNGGHNLEYPIHCFSTKINPLVKSFISWNTTNKEIPFHYYMSKTMRNK